MGDIINKRAAVDDIVIDCRSTLIAGEARGAPVGPLAEQYLKVPLATFDMVEQRLKGATSAFFLLRAKKDAVDDIADALLRRSADEIWNDLGRPSADPLYALLFPDGVSFYTDGPDAEQPARMELLAEMLEAQLHPKLDAKKSKLIAKQIRESAKALRSAVEQATPAGAQVAMLSRARTAIGRSLQLSLVSLKRHYRASGLTEAQIHDVIPDRSRPRAKTRPVPPPAVTTAQATA